MIGAFLGMAIMFGAFAYTSANPVTATITVFFLGMGLMLPTGLQMRLMEVAGDAQTLGAALNHSAFNIANALGAWLGGDRARRRSRPDRADGPRRRPLARGPGDLPGRAGAGAAWGLTAQATSAGTDAAASAGDRAVVLAGGSTSG